MPESNPVSSPFKKQIIKSRYDDGKRYELAKSAGNSAKLRESLAAKGTLIGPLDSLIAGQALEHQPILVTGNIREFSRVDGLAIENWSES